MSSTATSVQQTEMRQFLQASLWALVRAEVEGRVPARFTRTGKDVWDTFRNELTASDQVARFHSVRVCGNHGGHPHRYLEACTPARAFLTVLETIHLAEQVYSRYP